jgi:hypothetical protein
LALLITVAPAFPAELSINLVGKWQGTTNCVKYDPSATPPQKYYSKTLTIRLLNQNGDRFYGQTSNDKGATWMDFIGVISEGKLMMTNADTVMSANMPFLEGGYWRMIGYYQRPAKTDGGDFSTGKFTVHRTSLTP